MEIGSFIVGIFFLALLVAVIALGVRIGSGKK